MARNLSNRDHVSRAHPDILRGYITPAKAFDARGKRGYQRVTFAAIRIRQDNRFAAAHRQASHRVFVTHPA